LNNETLSDPNTNLKKANLPTDKHGWHGLKIQNGFYRTFLICVNQRYLWRGLGFLCKAAWAYQPVTTFPLKTNRLLAAGGAYFVFLCG